MRWLNFENRYRSHLEKLKSLSPYDLIGVDPNASKAELRGAYLSKIKIYHPDRAGKFMKQYCEEVTKLLNSAYEDLEKKQHD